MKFENVVPKQTIISLALGIVVAIGVIVVAFLRM